MVLNFQLQTKEKNCQAGVKLDLGFKGDTHKVCDGPQASVLVLLEEAREQSAESVGLPRRQRQRFVQDTIVHLCYVPTVERGLCMGRMTEV